MARKRSLQGGVTRTSNRKACFYALQRVVAHNRVDLDSYFVGETLAQPESWKEAAVRLVGSVLRVEPVSGPIARIQEMRRECYHYGERKLLGTWFEASDSLIRQTSLPIAVHETIF